MSLDVSLTIDRGMSMKRYTVFVRPDVVCSISMQASEWNRLHPDKAIPEMLEAETMDTMEVFTSGLTHNLVTMAAAAGIYLVIWRPEECGIIRAGQLVDRLTVGLAKLKSDPARFVEHNSANGWGTYEQFVSWVEVYLEACERYPDAKVSADR